MVEFCFLCRLHLLAAVLLSAYREVLETMAYGSLSEFGQKLCECSGDQFGFRFYNLDSTSTYYMEPADVERKKDRSLGGISHWFFVSWRAFFPGYQISATECETS